MTKIREWKEEWNKLYGDDFDGGLRDKYYDWWLSRFQQELSSLEGEIMEIDFYGWDENTQRMIFEKVRAIIRQHKEG